MSAAKTILLLAASALAACAARADGTLADANAVVSVATTGVATNFSWRKNVLAETLGTDAAEAAASAWRLRDALGAVASVAQAEAEAETAENCAAVAAAWGAGFSDGVASLSASLTNAPTSGRFVGLVFPLVPQTSRPFDIFVASNHYDAAANEDVLYVHFGRDFEIAPTLNVPYVYESGLTTNRVAGAWKKAGTDDCWSNVWPVVYSRTSGDVEYQCHRLFAKRPAALAGAPLNLMPHGTWGGPDGVAFGKYILTVSTGGVTRATFSGTVTNAAEGVAAVFDNGAFVGTVPAGASQEGDGE